MASDKTKPTIIPTIQYRDEKAAIEWLCRVFGFEKQLIVAGPDDSIAHAQLTLANGMVMLGAIEKEINMYVVVPDADAVYARVEAAGAKETLTVRDSQHEYVFTPSP